MAVREVGCQIATATPIPAREGPEEKPWDAQ
jgi:hypothetical protein